jgi:hypothetical protein
MENPGQFRVEINTECFSLRSLSIFWTACTIAVDGVTDLAYVEIVLDKKRASTSGVLLCVHRFLT